MDTNDCGCPRDDKDKDLASISPPSLERRSFLGVLTTIGTVGMGAVLFVPLMKFAMHPLLADTTETAWSDVGPVDEFGAATAPVKKLVVIEQRDGWRKVTSEKPVYVLPGPGGGFRVLSAVCPHLGCTVPWKEQEGKFICPCHVGVFDGEGRRVAGPPPRDMDVLESKVENGVLKVRYQFFRQLTPSREVMA
ncbi:MAG TPA: ubiquinol-cytochrome c reductase iron-sulfur subunit [Terriglobales bacterium]|nr:ubiquinol-cytochrome c reductase iron-sulfur subunit [Terriglobales bacterium]